MPIEVKPQNEFIQISIEVDKSDKTMITFKRKWFLNTFDFNLKIKIIKIKLSAQIIISNKKLIYQ